MIKNKWLLRTATFTILLFPLYSFASVHANMSKQGGIQMHEDMLKIQQEVIKCLKSDKSKKECKKSYRKNMKKIHKKYMNSSKHRGCCHDKMCHHKPN